MAIRIDANVAKRVPIPGIDYSSRQASITITAEVTDISQVVEEARRLYALAEQAVDQQLALAAAAPPVAAPVQPPVAYQPQVGAQSRPTSRVPSTGRSAPRRGIPPISDAQRRLLDRLLSGDPQQADAICQRAGVATIGALNMKQASETIDWLKSQAVPA